mmetsp:Transcript_38065/g.72971  ORF Transcript_38065/g.72971 Transcript_38065/m.72971 type:complete len:172 (+) Transcript_38065:356-871(+)|eukprot:CAMPEP_0114237126 /NCGR_PEP_ID=MMETSP0058-20121206/7218_1 /TAXON_ID=36894 /ORGANISM="Pyramimonas parkeae, CCMP726" /LENGTH=171 /DNA_ID=CAMNT_0001349135 /DNA_START=299 /DNA_END=814 /DNA_ORIENTATION=+
MRRPDSSGADAVAHETPVALPQKVVEYEQFMDRLKADLLLVNSQREGTQSQIDTYRDLVANIQLLEDEGQQQLRTLVNLGADFFCQAEVADTQRLFVDIGLGFHVEFTRSEAANFAEAKIKTLQEKSSMLADQAASIKANIKLVGEGVAELMKLSSEPAKSREVRGGFSHA